MLHAEFTHADLLQAVGCYFRPGWHSVRNEGRHDVGLTLGDDRANGLCTRREMAGMWSSEDILKIVPDA